MRYSPLIIAAFAIAFATACLFHMQLTRESPPKQIVIGSVAATIVGLVALTFALV
jgi:hypothetical protein